MVYLCDDASVNRNDGVMTSNRRNEIRARKLNCFSSKHSGHGFSNTVVVVNRHILDSFERQRGPIHTNGAEKSEYTIKTVNPRTEEDCRICA